MREAATKLTAGKRRGYNLAEAAARLAVAYGDRPPWRGPRDYEPFRVLAREILLCRTSTRAAVRPHRRLFRRWPEPADLAGADVAEVEAVLRPLGMQRVRAGRLVELARLVVEAGEVPADRDALMALPGVGRYVADATLRLAFGRATAPIDGVNVRVFERVGVAPGTLFRALDAAFGDRRLPLHALLWLASERCRPRGPRCAGCPLGSACATRGETR